MAAARRIEAGERYSMYPCWSIAETDGTGCENWHHSENVERFLSVFSASKNVHDKSDQYLDSMNIGDRDQVVLSLCFAAALVEAGDA